MKTLIVYYRDSFYKFHNLFDEHTYELSQDMLKVYAISPIVGEEFLVAMFKTWDYFLIEQD